MLKQLILSNFILIDHADIPFDKGFNILSGETGSGKTMLMQALSLLFGQKADPKLIRASQECAKLSCVIDLSENENLSNILKEIGVEIDDQEELLIKREFTSASKNRAFINNQQVSLAALKKIAPYILEIVSTSTQLELKDENIQLEYLDIFAELEEELSSYKESYHEEDSLKKELKQIETSFEESRHLAPYWNSCIQEIESADLKPNEDEELFETFKMLSQSQDLLSLIQDVKQILEDDEVSVLSQLGIMRQLFSKMIKRTPLFGESFKQVNEAFEILSEVSFSLSNYIDKIDMDPKKLEELEQRLSLINSLKKRYSNNVLEIIKHKEDLEKKLFNYHNHEELLESKRKELSNKSIIRKEKAACLTKRRVNAALQLAQLLEKELKSMNMESATLEIKVSESSPSSLGSDKVEFFFRANTGENIMPLKIAASGGELARILLALKLVLADKQKEKILIFDEIDANIGGETASLIAKKLSDLGRKRQIFCITHFPQVAKEAHSHLKIQKKVVGNRTITSIEKLFDKDRKQELLRMFGGEKELLS